MSSFADLAGQIDAQSPSKGEAPASNFSDLASEIDVKAKSMPVAKGTESVEPGYASKIGAAIKEVGRTVNLGNLKPAFGEAAMNMVSSAPIALVKHGVEEGAYLSGQSPEQAEITAQRVIPTDGIQPASAAGQAITGLVGAVGQPLVDLGSWAASKAGFSPSAQKIAGDFAPVVVPMAAGKAYTGLGKAVDYVNEAPLADLKGLAKDIGQKGSLADMQKRYAEAVQAGKAPEPVATGPTPQQLRGQEPIETAVVPDKAPPITVDNASPPLKEAIRSLGKEANPVAVQRHLEADSLPVQMRLSEGQATGNLHTLSDEFNKRGTPAGKVIADLHNEQNGRLIENINAIRDKAAPAVNALDHVENGETLMGAYKAKDAVLEQDIGAKYKALEEANGGQFPLNGKQFVDAADAALAKKLKSHYVPSEVRATLNDLRDGGRMTFEDFETLRSDLAETARSAQDGKVRAAASIIRQQLEDLPMPAGAEHLKPLADAARSAAKARFDLLNADPAYKAAVNDSVAPDKFVQKYIVNGNKADLARMNENLQGDPVAQQSIAAGALNYLKSRAGIVGDNGAFSQAGYNKALEGLKPKLDYLFDPVTAQQVQTLGDVARYVKQQPAGSYFNNSGTAVSLLKDFATSGVEGAINVKTGGVYGALKDIATSGKQQKAAAEAVQPGAGLKPRR